MSYPLRPKQKRVKELGTAEKHSALQKGKGPSASTTHILVCVIAIAKSLARMENEGNLLQSKLGLFSLEAEKFRQVRLQGGPGVFVSNKVKAEEW